jgi:S-formylglutathione hydrolase FrmB
MHRRAAMRQACPSSRVIAGTSTAVSRDLRSKRGKTCAFNQKSLTNVGLFRCPLATAEPSVLVQSQEFAARARQLDLQLTTDFYGPGSHSFPYWRRELHRAFPLLMDAVAARPSAK